MDREEAITELTVHFEHWKRLKEEHIASVEESDRTIESLRMAIEALSAEQKEEELANDIARRMATIIENEQDMRVILKNASAEQTDLISRADAIALLTKIVFDEPPYLDSETLCRLYAEEQINALPSADRPSGEWIRSVVDFTDGSHAYHHHCNNCNEEVFVESNLCPKCGARMKGGVE